jgi:hypothetical protein
MNTLATQRLMMIVKATFRKQKNFHFIKNISQNTDYQILTRMIKKNYENSIISRKDQFPTINANRQFEG